ncbi:MAG: peptide chain release factor N(5)-glutamine methyltransferase, partial [Pseudoalteromonas sp.]|nr:peptide chain release factor N(5)-glutamine methyltransferase [Pseudoalteromonas sp.]
MTPSVENAITTGTNLLASSSDSAKLDAQVLLLNILQKPRSYLFTWPEKQLTDQQYQAFQHACERRLQGEPVSHITGCREFWSLQLEVNPTTLIPRPDTETLVELALECEVPKNAKVLDLGTGTGAIALALGSEMPSWDIIAVERLDDAVALAKRN